MKTIPTFEPGFPPEFHVHLPLRRGIPFGRPQVTVVHTPRRGQNVQASVAVF
jgi:hypothetical protein